MRSLAFVLLAIASARPAQADALDKLARAVEQNGNFKVRLKAAHKLARFEDPRAVETLVFALTDPHPLVRASAANSLGRMKQRSALPKLCSLQRDADDFVRRTAQSALANFGGPAVCTGSQKVFVRLTVNGGSADTNTHVESGLRSKATADARVLLEPSDTATHRLELMVRVDEKVDRSAAPVKIECVMSQSIFTLRADDQRSLQGSATQRGVIELGATANEQAVASNMRVCMEHLVPVVYDGFSGFLDRLR